MAAIFRFKARKAGSTFWKWKYIPFDVRQRAPVKHQPTNEQLLNPTKAEKLEIRRNKTEHDRDEEIEQSKGKVDTEAEHLMNKYKLHNIMSQSTSQGKAQNHVHPYNPSNERNVSRDRSGKKKLNQSGKETGNQVVLTDENIDEDDGVEATISQHKKSKFAQPVAIAGPDKDKYDFCNEETIFNAQKSTGENNVQIIESIKKPDDGTVPASEKPQIYYQILNSKNKDFGKILRTSESMASDTDFEEIGGSAIVTGGITTAHGNQSRFQQKSIVEINNQITERIVKQSKSVMLVTKILETRLRKVVRFWRQETVAYLNEMDFKLRS